MTVDNQRSLASLSTKGGGEMGQVMMFWPLSEKNMRFFLTSSTRHIPFVGVASYTFISILVSQDKLESVVSIISAGGK